MRMGVCGYRHGEMFSAGCLIWGGGGGGGGGGRGGGGGEGGWGGGGEEGVSESLLSWLWCTNVRRK